MNYTETIAGAHWCRLVPTLGTLIRALNVQQCTHHLVIGVGHPIVHQLHQWAMIWYQLMEADAGTGTARLMHWLSIYQLRATAINISITLHTPQSIESLISFFFFSVFFSSILRHFFIFFFLFFYFLFLLFWIISA